MKDNPQNKTPYFSKLKDYGLTIESPFDTPGHKLGRVENDMSVFIGKNTFLLDGIGAPDLDNLSRPTGVIKEAQDLFASACGADQCFFLTNGTTMGNIAMIMTACSIGEKIIMPRNVHKSIINALILSGAIPIFMKPEVDTNFALATAVSFDTVKATIDENKDAKAILVINPTYYGVSSELKKITDYAHQYNIMVLVDEAHGALFYFSGQLPTSAMKAGADMSASSIHKTAGSLTQSSVLLTQGNLINYPKLRSSLNILQSTSPSALLLASLDVARKLLYFKGKQIIQNIIEMANGTICRLKEIPGIMVMDKEYILTNTKFDFDETRLVIKVSNLGFSGQELNFILRKEYGIQIELGDENNILCLLTVGTTKKDLDNLVMAFKDLSNKYYKAEFKTRKTVFNYKIPQTILKPRAAYYASKITVDLDQAINKIAGELIMTYPPGIPIAIPGELITQDMIDNIKEHLKIGSTLINNSDKNMITILKDKKI